MYQCNKCNTHKCRVIESEFPKFRTKHKVSETMMKESCASATVLENFKMPLLIMAMPRSAKAIAKILTEAKLNIWEISRYPFFQLVER